MIPSLVDVHSLLPSALSPSISACHSSIHSFDNGITAMILHAGIFAGSADKIPTEGNIGRTGKNSTLRLTRYSHPLAIQAQVRW